MRLCHSQLYLNTCIFQTLGKVNQVQKQAQFWEPKYSAELCQFCYWTKLSQCRKTANWTVLLQNRRPCTKDRSPAIQMNRKDWSVILWNLENDYLGLGHFPNTAVTHTTVKRYKSLVFHSHCSPVRHYTSWEKKHSSRKITTQLYGFCYRY